MPRRKTLKSAKLKIKRGNKNVVIIEGTDLMTKKGVEALGEEVESIIETVSRVHVLLSTSILSI